MVNCPICNSELTTDSFGLFCPNESCCFIYEIPNIANEKGIIPLLYENDKLIKWIKVVLDRFPGRKEWYLNGLCHREDGPAMEWNDGRKDWFLNGDRHREDGPAIEYPDGTKTWYLNGQLHREDGPAVEWFTNHKEWYLNGQRKNSLFFILYFYINSWFRKCQKIKIQIAQFVNLN